MFDLYTIIFLALAVFIFVRLRSVLGSRTGRERPPYDPFSAPDPTAKPANSRDKVVTLPGRTAPTPQREGEAAQAPGERWAGIAEPGSALAVGLDAIAAQDREFDIGHFLSVAKAADGFSIDLYIGDDPQRRMRALSLSYVARCTFPELPELAGEVQKFVFRQALAPEQNDQVVQ